VQMDVAPLVDDQGGSSDLQLKDAVILRKSSDHWYARVGYTQFPFGYEVTSSDADNWTFNKSFVMNKLLPGERDTGLYFEYKPSNPNAPMFDIGYSNGPQKWHNADKFGNRDTDAHALVARAQMLLPRGGSAGVSAMLAKRRGTIGATATNPALPYDFSDANVWGAHVNWVGSENWVARAEYFDGKLPTVSGATVTDKSTSGWYAFASYTSPKNNVTGFYRYDTFDGTARTYRRHTFGVGRERNKNERYTLLIERIANDGSGKADTNIGAQWQVKY